MAPRIQSPGSKIRGSGVRFVSVVLACVLATFPVATTRGEVSSWGWRASLARSGLKAQSLQASATVPANAYTQPPGVVVEPKGTTAYLAELTRRRDLAPVRFDAARPTLGPLLGEEARIKAGDCSNVESFNGLLPNNPYYNFERWVRSLNPKAFDRNHPNLGAVLAQDQRVRLLIASCAAPQAQALIPPTNGTTGGITATGNVSALEAGSPAAVPEPTSLAIVLIGTGVLLARRLVPWLQRSAGVRVH